MKDNEIYNNGYQYAKGILEGIAFLCPDNRTATIWMDAYIKGIGDKEKIYMRRTVSKLLGISYY